MIWPGCLINDPHQRPQTNSTIRVQCDEGRRGQIPFGWVADRAHHDEGQLICLGDPGDGSALQVDRMGMRRREQPPLRRRFSDDRCARQ